MSIAARLAKGRLHYGWIVAAVTFLALLAAAGIRSTPGVLIVPLEHEFHWTRTEISLAVSVNIALYGLMGPFAAALMDRLGTRTTMFLSATLVAIGVALTTLMTASWQLVLLWGVVVGTGTGMTAMALAATVVNRWFKERSGLVTGVLTASTATGQLVFLPAMATVIEHYGWRAAVLGIAGVGLVILPLIGIFMRDRPRELGLMPYGATDDPPPPAPVRNPFAASFGALWRGMQSRDFWLLFGSFFICGASTNGLIGTHLIPACIDHGIPEVTAAGLLAAMGIFDFFGTTISGWLSDRFDNRILLAWYYGLRGLSLLFLPYAMDLSFYGLSLFALFYGLDWIATVPPTVRLTANAFGRENVGLTFGWIGFGHQLGAAAAASAAGIIRTDFGDYFQAFFGAGLLCLVAATIVLGIGRRPSRRLEAPAVA